MLSSQRSSVFKLAAIIQSECDHSSIPANRLTAQLIRTHCMRLRTSPVPRRPWAASTRRLSIVPRPWRSCKCKSLRNDLMNGVTCNNQFNVGPPKRQCVGRGHSDRDQLCGNDLVWPSSACLFSTYCTYAGVPTRKPRAPAFPVLQLPRRKLLETRYEFTRIFAKFKQLLS